MYYSVPLLPRTGKEQKKIAIKISTIEDIDKVELSSCVREYLTNFVQSILETYQTDNLSNCGCVYFLNLQGDMQLNGVPLKEIPCEFCEEIHLKSSHEEVCLLHGCFVVNNDYAVDIFGLESVFDKETLEVWKSNMEDNHVS